MVRLDGAVMRDRCVLVTRPVGQAETLCQLIESAGGRAIHFPVIDIQPLVDTGQAESLRVRLPDIDMLIFISTNAVRCIIVLLPDIFSLYAKKAILAVGSATHQALLYNGVVDILSDEAGSSSEALLALAALQSERVSGKKIIIIRGVGGRELLAETLRQRGAEVEYLEVYQRLKPNADPSVLKNIWRVERPNAVVVTSAEGLQNLIDMTGSADRNTLFNTPLIVISSRLQTYALTLGFAITAEVATVASDEGLMQALINKSL